MPRISRDIGEDAGLFEFSKPLIVSFVDTPMQIDTTGGDTYFNLQTGLGESEIVVPVFLAELKKEARLPNSALTTLDRKTGYLSILFSKASITEISNQVHLQKYIGQTPGPTILDQIDKDSNQLGVKYAQQMITRQAKPFIIVNEIKP